MRQTEIKNEFNKIWDKLNELSNKLDSIKKVEYLNTMPSKVVNKPANLIKKEEIVEENKLIKENKREVENE